PQKIREVIDRIVRQRVDQGQLREAPITQAQLETVKDQFTRVLAGMYQPRTDYPAASGGITAEFGSGEVKSAAAAPNEPPTGETASACPRSASAQVKSR